MSDAAIPSYLEIIDFIAAGTTPQAIIDYRPSLEAQQCVAELIAREQECGLPPEEQSELNHFMDLEHIPARGSTAPELPMPKVHITACSKESDAPKSPGFGNPR